jgi:hypothetical protein
LHFLYVSFLSLNVLPNHGKVENIKCWSEANRIYFSPRWLLWLLKGSNENSCASKEQKMDTDSSKIGNVYLVKFLLHQIIIIVTIAFILHWIFLIAISTISIRKSIEMFSVSFRTSLVLVCFLFLRGICCIRMGLCYMLDFIFIDEIWSWRYSFLI